MAHSLRRRAALGGAMALFGLGLATAFAPWATARAAEPTFAFITYNQQALFFTQMSAGAKQAAQNAGVGLVIYDPNNDPAAQNNAFDDFIQQKVRGIIIAAIDVNGVEREIQKAAAARIPVVALDAILPPGPQKSQIGVDNVEGGARIGKFLADQLHGTPTKLGIVEALNSFIQNQRQKGFQDALKSTPNIKLVQVVDGRNVQDNAMSVAETLLTANPELDAIYATGEPALIGAIAAIESQGRQGKVKVVGWDLSAQAIKAIDEGFLIGVVQQDPSVMGAAAVDALVSLSKGGTVPPVINTELDIVTKANVDPYRAVFK
jgi:ribose transport system substrate-binding protein